MTWPEYLVGCCRIDGRLTRLAFYEADLLCVLLIADPTGPITAADIGERMWPDANKAPLNVRQHVSATIWHLRRRGIEIENRHGFGYRIPRHARGRQPRKLAA